MTMKTLRGAWHSTTVSKNSWNVGSVVTAIGCFFDRRQSTLHPLPLCLGVSAGVLVRASSSERCPLTLTPDADP